MLNEHRGPPQAHRSILAQAARRGGEEWNGALEHSQGSGPSSAALVEARQGPARISAGSQGFSRRSHHDVAAHCCLVL